jgi:hypothetical protein
MQIAISRFFTFGKVNTQAVLPNGLRQRTVWAGVDNV